MNLLRHDTNYWMLALAGMLISTLHFQIFYYAHDTPKWWVFDTLLSLYILRQARVFNTLVGGYFLILVAVLWLYMVASLWWAPHTMMGIEFIVRFSLVMVAGYAMVNGLAREQLLQYFLNIVVLSAAAFVALFYLERYGLKFTYNVGSFSPIGFMNNAGQVFNVWVPAIVLYGFLNRQSRWKLGVVAILLLALVSILMEAGTRGAIIGLALGELMVFTIMLGQNIKRAFYFLSITLLLTAGIVSYQVFDALQSGRISHKIAAMENNISASTGRRMDMFKNTLDMALDRPMGVGVNNFEYFHPKYGKPGTVNSSPFINENQILRTPHNIVLKMYAELGWIGGTLWLGMLGWLALSALINAIKGSVIDKWLLVSVVATLFHSLVSAVFLTPASLFFSGLLFALVLKRSHYLIKPRVVINKPIRWPVRWTFAAVPILSSVLVTSEAMAFQGSQQYNPELLRWALRLNPYNDRALYTLSHVQYRRLKDVSASRQSIEQFIKINPYHIAGLYLQSERQFLTGEYDQAMESVRTLLEIYPSYTKAQRLFKAIQQKKTNALVNG